ncbi:MAG: OFA family MFS transporter [Gammaproteobacteria bacterium]|nr:OFA family MFS transporter [Gammaproteobacteria bacterium]
MRTGLLSKERIVAPRGYNRWRIVPAALGIHLCIGSVYAWSIFNPALVRQMGVVASAADDWTLREVMRVFTVAIVFLGLAAALAGRWLEHAGPRRAGVVAACCWGGGLVLGGVGIGLHELWLVYLGYGVLGGCGLGLGYISPVSTLIKWFPDRRGMATGLAIMGFGGGAIVGAPLNEALLRFFHAPPEHVGAAADLGLVTDAGRRFAEIGGRLAEVVVVAADDPVAAGTMPGAYLVGTGSTGAAQTFVTLGVVHLAVMLAAAFAYRVPRDDWRPGPPAQARAARRARRPATSRDVHIDQALKTRQFYQLWVVLCVNVTAGIGVLGVAGTMLADIFGRALPRIVDGGFVAAYVVAIGVFNMAGRFLWATASDYIGRRGTYCVFFAAGIGLYCAIPMAAHGVGADPGAGWLLWFCAATFAIFTMYGGGFATIPAYLADVFGTRYVGGIHGRLLTAWSVAGVAGPLLVTTLRERAVGDAIGDLAATVDPARFAQAFGAGMEELPALVAAKTVTIASLMEIAPAGTADPTSGIYNTTMYAMAGLLAVGLASNALMGPVSPEHHLSRTC